MRRHRRRSREVDEDTAGTSQQQQQLLPLNSGGLLWLSLPLEVLELICSSLPMPDRRQTAKPELSASLSTWLARHKAAVRSLQLSCGAGSPAVVLAGLAGGAVSSLEIHDTQGVGLELAEALGPLVCLGSSLKTLQLSCCRLGGIPPQLSALSALQSLSLPGNTGLAAAGEAGFGPLAAATQLTALWLTGCALRRLPPQLTALAPSLKVLGLANNTNLGHWVAGSLHHLTRLTAVTHLEMSHCSLPCIPPQLSALRDLQHLAMRGNTLGVAEVEDYEPLRQLTHLTHLDLSDCHLALLPPQLSCLSALAALDLGANPGLGPILAAPPNLLPMAAAALAGAGSSSWQPLGSLAASLSSLDISGCEVAALSDGFSCLSALESLDLSGNVVLGLGEGSGTALQPLTALTGLSHLRLECCGLSRVPSQLNLLPALYQLSVSYNPSLGDHGQELVRQLRELAALTSLDLKGCLILNPSIVMSMTERGVRVITK
ncbi:hypothetical protein N2152v2_009988 [Parachlorella kessleri]